MSSVQFDRVCRLILGKDGSGIDFSGMRITFSIKKTSDAKANEAKIELYNLSPEHAQMLMEQWKDILLVAGYKGSEQMIFTGQIRQVTRKVQGTDRILTIESGDGDKAMQKGKVNKTHKKGYTDTQIAKDCQDGMSIPTAHQDPLPQKQHSRGKTISGSAAKNLSKIAMKHDVQWSIQDGQLLMLQGKNTRPNATFLINSATGLLGSPEETEDGVRVSTLLNPAYLIGGYTVIESIDYNGAMRIESIEHTGDTHSSDWSSKLEGIAL